MDMTAFYKSVLDQDTDPVVICDLNHTIIYMNQAAADNYAKDGGWNLMGKSVLDCHPPQAQAAVKKVVDWFAQKPENNRIHTFFSRKNCKDIYMVALRDESGALIGYYEKHERRTPDSEPYYNFT